ncbi:uncharacterized protein LOC126978002 [Leptidea sinapis]|uniref:uncharacterized protein LOC126978002 n=1 Tax=Leptidea sinapis TaxID=189913 RepID=UPI002127E7C5|nr:uncharacterized protein LOC126978002 [Leptidea sinapis]
MRSFVVLCLCASGCIVMGQDIEAMKNMPKYDSRYDYLDVDALFNSKRLVRNYVDCLINGLRCTPEGKALKRLLPEALRTKCVRCTERQKRTAVKIIKRLKYEYPDEWAKLASRWDPTGDFTRYFEVYLFNEQFNTIGGNEIPRTNLPPRLSPQPPVATSTVTTQPPPTASSATMPPSPRPLLLNRFGDEGELMVGSPSSAMVPPIAVPLTSPTPPAAAPPSRAPVPPRPTPVSWSYAETEMTRFPSRIDQQFTTAMTFIDQIGIKIIRTTELVTDILKNTVRAVVGG